MFFKPQVAKFCLVSRHASPEFHGT